MFILTFFIVVALTQFITNKILKLSDENKISYSYSKRDGLIICGFLVIGVLLQFLLKVEGKMFFIVDGIYAAAILFTMIVLATMKKVVVEKQKEDMKKVFDVLGPALPKNAEFDINTLPFKLDYEDNKINKITMDIINPTTFKEDLAINICLSLNKYLPDYEWVPEFDYAARECAFVGTPLPPHVARYPGSWLRPAEFIPIGLTGLGELAWVINSFKGEGRSLYVYDDGKKAKTVDSPSAPQALVVGGPLGLNTIIPTTNGYKTMKTIEVGDEVFGYSNKPVKVLEVLDIHEPKETYSLLFADENNNVISIVSDEIHRFPVLKENKIEPVHCKDLIEDDIIIGNNNFRLISKNKIKNELVRCIKVDSEEHIFLITDKKEDWNGGISYPYLALYTYNTGGGKAIYVDQEVDVLDDL